MGTSFRKTLFTEDRWGWDIIAKVVALIDGEHYFPVIKAALDKLTNEEGHELAGTVFIGGTEKLKEEIDLEKELGYPVIINNNSETAIKKAIKKWAPHYLIDLSDEPIVGYKERFRYASLALLEGVGYRGSDFLFDPPIFEDIISKPTISIIGTGKRVGKTAVSAFISRSLQKGGFQPCVVAMGRGGPLNPEIIRGDKFELTPDKLLKLSNQGKHAASDHYEDALMSRVFTIGCRRCGGGMSGQPYYDNVREGAKIAEESSAKFIIFEGSGAALPPIKTDYKVVIVGANQPIDYINGYFGTYRIMLSQLAVITMCEEPLASDKQIESVYKAIKEIKPDIRIVKTIFRPKPLDDIKNRKVFLTTTAPYEILKKINNYIEKEYGAKIVGASPHLANRRLLRRDIEDCKEDFNLLLTELKAASVDLVTKLGFDLGVDVVFMDNIPVNIGGDGELRSLFLDLVNKAIKDKEEWISAKKQTV